MPEDEQTIVFTDYGEYQEACIIIRRIKDKIALCLSLESDGDIEAILDHETAEKLIAAIRAATRDISR